MRKLLAVIVVLVVLAILFFHPTVRSVNNLIEEAVGVKTASLKELKQMADKGLIPEEVYKLALFEKLRNPSVFFKYGYGKVYEFLNGTSRILQGRYIEKINDSLLRLVIVCYDDLFTNKYLVIKVDLPTKKLYPFSVHEYGYPGKYQVFVKKVNGTWTYVSPYVKMNGTLVVEYVINKNPEDWKIAKTIADQILDFARANGLTRSQAAEVFYEEVMLFALLRYDQAPPWWNRTYSILALSGDRLIKLKMNDSDSVLKAMLLNGTGECYSYNLLTTYVLNELGVHAFETGVIAKWANNEWHAVTLISKDDLKNSELKHKFKAVFKARFNNSIKDYYVIDTTGNIRGTLLDPFAFGSHPRIGKKVIILVFKKFKNLS